MINPFAYTASMHEVLRLDFEGTNGSTTIVDSTGRHSPVAYNGASISTAWAATGSSSLYLPSVSLDDYVQVDATANNDFIHTGDFRYKGVIKMTSLYSNYVMFWNTNALGGGVDTTTQKFFVQVTSGTGQIRVRVATTSMLGTAVTIGIPQTIELSRVGNTVSLIQDGVTTATMTSNTVWGSGFLSLGGNGGALAFKGYIDNFVVQEA
jgi:hypothetical protein